MSNTSVYVNIISMYIFISTTVLNMSMKNKMKVCGTTTRGPGDEGKDGKT